MEKEKLIINTIRKEKKISATKLARLTGLHYYDIREILFKLSEKNMIKFERSKFGTYKFWSLKE